MNSALATTILSSVTAVVVTLLVNVFTLRRERAAEWRKLKLERYEELISAMSSIVGSRSNAEAQNRYSDAFNTLDLVAPQSVVIALYRFQDKISIASKNCCNRRNDLLLTTLIHEIRKDIGPDKSYDGLTYRIIDVPIENDSNA